VDTSTQPVAIIGLPGLQAARRARGLSQRELARVAGVAHTTICHLETATHDARGVTLRRLAAALDVPSAQLLLGDDYPAPAPPPPAEPTPTPARKRRRRS
jgi:transcriptional regulator with XRE-family HTH domain